MRLEIARDAPESQRAEVLRQIGQARVGPMVRAPEDVEKFQRLGYAGAYAVDTPNVALAAKVREVLAPNYRIMPDIDMWDCPGQCSLGVLPGAPPQELQVSEPELDG